MMFENRKGSSETMLPLTNILVHKLNGKIRVENTLNFTYTEQNTKSKYVRKQEKQFEIRKRTFENNITFENIISTYIKHAKRKSLKMSIDNIYEWSLFVVFFPE